MLSPTGLAALVFLLTFIVMNVFAICTKDMWCMPMVSVQPVHQTIFNASFVLGVIIMTDTSVVMGHSFQITTIKTNLVVCQVILPR